MESDDYFPICDMMPSNDIFDFFDKFSKFSGLNMIYKNENNPIKRNPLCGYQYIETGEIALEFYNREARIYCLKSILRDILKTHIAENILDRAFSHQAEYPVKEIEGVCDITFSDKKRTFQIKDLQLLKSEFLLSQNYTDIFIDMPHKNFDKVLIYVNAWTNQDLLFDDDIFRDLDYLGSQLAVKMASKFIQDFLM